MNSAEVQQIRDVVDLLRHGGLDIEEPGDASRSEPPVVSRYNGLVDPQGSEILGTRLADDLRDAEPTSILIWQAPNDIVLGYVVARELGVKAVRSYDLNGLVEFEGTFEPGGRVALVADVFREPEPVRAMCALAEQQGQEVVAAAALVAVPSPGSAEVHEQGIRLISLVDATTVSERSRSH